MSLSNHSTFNQFNFSYSILLGDLIECLLDHIAQYFGKNRQGQNLRLGLGLGGASRSRPMLRRPVLLCSDNIFCGRQGGQCCEQGGGAKAPSLLESGMFGPRPVSIASGEENDRRQLDGWPRRISTAKEAVCQRCLKAAGKAAQ